MSSGLAVDDQCRTIFEAIKTKKIFRYCVFYIKDERFITVEMTGDRHASYQDFLQDLQREGDRSCRYGLYDFEYKHQCQGHWRPPPSRSWSWCWCVRTLPRSRIRCCMLVLSKLWRSPWLEFTSVFRYQILLRQLLIKLRNSWGSLTGHEEET